MGRGRGGGGRAVGGRKAILNGILFSELYQLANVSYKRKKEGRNFMHWNSPSQLQTLQASAARLSSPLHNPGHYISPSASWGLLSCWWDWILPLPQETFPPQTGSGAHSSCAELPWRIKDAALINYCAQLPITAWLSCWLHFLLKRKCQGSSCRPSAGK